MMDFSKSSRKDFHGELAYWLIGFGELTHMQGLGKRVPVSSFRQQRRNGRGKRAISLNPSDTLAAVHMVSISCKQVSAMLPLQ